MSKVRVPSEFNYNEKRKARTSLRRREEALLKQKRFKGAKTIANNNYLYKYMIKEDRYEAKRDENGSVIFFGYTPCKPYLKRWNMRGKWSKNRRIVNKKMRRTPYEYTAKRCQYKKLCNISYYY